MSAIPPIQPRDASSGTKRAGPRTIAKNVLEQFGLVKGAMRSLEKRMRPGQLSGSGFLGRNESLIDVLMEDQATLEKAGVSYDAVANLLAGVATEPFFPPREYDVIVNGNLYHVERMEWRGHQICPYDCGSYGESNRSDTQEVGFDKEFNYLRDIHDRGSMDFNVTNPRTGERLYFPGLLIHLVRAHHFFEGKGTTRRADPESIIKFFGLEPGKEPEVEIVKTPEFMSFLLGNRIRSLHTNFSFLSLSPGSISPDYALKRVRKYIDEGLLEGIDRTVLEEFYRGLIDRMPHDLKLLSHSDFESLLTDLFRPLWVKFRQTYGT